jgi:anti-anti-sigma regulatory factor
MLRIRRSGNGEAVFTLSGRMDENDTGELETVIRAEANGARIVLDLKDLTLVNQDAVNFLERCEAENITLRNCPAYIREWITRQRREAKG